MKNHIKNTSLSILALVSISMTSTAQAGAWKNIAGTMCQTYNSNGEHRVHRTTTGIVLAQDGAVDVYCPLEVETQYSTPMEVWLNYKKSTGSSMWCQLVRRGYAGSPVATTLFPGLVSGSPGSSFRSLTTYASGTMTVKCRLYKTGDRIYSFNHRLLP